METVWPSLGTGTPIVGFSPEDPKGTDPRINSHQNTPFTSPIRGDDSPANSPSIQK